MGKNAPQGQQDVSGHIHTSSQTTRMHPQDSTQPPRAESSQTPQIEKDTFQPYDAGFAHTDALATLGPRRITPASKRTILSWALWDWAGASFQAVVTTFIFSVYLTSSVFGSEEETSVTLGNAMLIAGLFIACLAPALGHITDSKGRHKLLLGFTSFIVAACMACMALVAPHPAYLPLGLILLTVGNVVYEFGNVSYNAMVSYISTPNNLGKISGFGMGMGYLGGIVLMTVVLIGFIQPEVGWFGVTSEEAWHVRGAMILCAVWFTLFSVPIFIYVKEEFPSSSAKNLNFSHTGTGPHATQFQDATSVPSMRTKPFATFAWAYRSVFYHLRSLWRSSRSTVWFLIASAVFRDGLAGVFTFGAVIAARSFGFEQNEVILFAIAANIISGIATILVGAFEDRVGARNVIIYSLILMLVFAALLFALHDGGQAIFWIFGLLLAIFVGPIQSSSRTYMARLIPQGKEGEAFGLYATTGRAVSFLSPAAWSIAIAVGGSTIFGVIGLGIVLLLGFLLFLKVPKPRRR